MTSPDRQRPPVRAAGGILNLNKPSGPTSFDVIRLVRKSTGMRKIGHAGTLDPLASGVLLVLLGQAVRISEYVMDLPKTYRATVRLGLSTDTYDAEGIPTHDPRPVDVSAGELEEALAAFVGDIDQTPPAFSAVKIAGKPAYQLARRGAAVTLAPRSAHVDRIDLLRYEPPDAEIEVQCGKGTYIRSLAHDLGQALGCGAHISALVRTRVGPFSIDSAHSLADLERAFDPSESGELLLPIDCGLTQLAAITLHIEDEKDIRHGQAVRIDEDRLHGLPLVGGGQYRAYAEDGGIVGIIRYEAETRLWRPHKVFALL